MEPFSLSQKFRGKTETWILLQTQDLLDPWSSMEITPASLPESITDDFPGVQDGKISNKKVKGRVCHREYVKF